MQSNTQIPNKYILASDTDSLMINVGRIMKYSHPDIDFNNNEQCLPIVKKYQEEISDKLNKYQSILAKKLLNSDEHYFDLKPEFIFKKAYWSGKRRYALHIVDQEGIPKDDFTMMGLDIMKSNFPPFFRNFGEQVIKNILFSVPKKDIDEQVLNFRESLRTVDWKQILKPTGLKKFDEYVERSPGAGEIFSKLALKCPINTKAAIYTADILKFKGLDKKYPPPQIGDKIYIVYLKENPYHIDVISLNGYNDAPELLEFAQKYIDRDGIFDSVLKNKLENLYRDINWGQPIFNRKINKFFTFN
jgi:hypothetical protein